MGDSKVHKRYVLDENEMLRRFERYLIEQSAPLRQLDAKALMHIFYAMVLGVMAGEVFVSDVEFGLNVFRELSRRPIEGYCCPTNSESYERYTQLREAMNHAVVWSFSLAVAIDQSRYKYLEMPTLAQLRGEFIRAVEETAEREDPNQRLSFESLGCSMD